MAAPIFDASQAAQARWSLNFAIFSISSYRNDPVFRRSNSSAPLATQAGMVKLSKVGLADP